MSEINDANEFTNELVKLVGRSYDVPSETRARDLLSYAALLIDAGMAGADTTALVDELIGIIKGWRGGRMTRERIISEEFGCPQEVMDRIGEALKMSGEQLERTGLDLDVLESARWLVEQGIKVETAEQVRASGAPIRHGYRGFVEAVVIAAKSLQIR